MRFALSLISIITIFTVTRSVSAEQIMPLDQVRPGMRGHGMTVFRGTTPERFDIEVIGVLHQFLTRQDLILIRMDHPLLERAGTVGGMSGSPIYIGDRLIGALAYGWLYSMDPIAGVTPIESMLEELDRPLRPTPPIVGHGMPRRRAASTGGPRTVARAGIFGPRPTYWSSFDDSDGPTPAATPLLLGGYTTRVRRMLAELLDDFGMFPVEAGGAGGGEPTDEPQRFVPGGAIGVQLVRGDLSATGIGTVTTLRGNRVLAFGHPMFGYGQQHYPVTTARIITILSSRRRSFKLGEPIAEAGGLIQDRQPCIIADTTRRVAMTRVSVRAHDRTTGRRDRYDLEIVPDRFLLPAFTVSSVASALERFASDRTDLMIRMRGEIELAEHGVITLSDQDFTELGTTDTRMIRGLRPLSALTEIMANPFEPARVERVELEVSFDFDRQEAEIVGAYVNAEQPRAGATIPVHVVLRPFEGEEEVRVIPIALPASTAGQEIQLHVSGGAQTQPPLPVPQGLPDLLSNLQRSYASTSLVITLQRRAPGVSMRGQIAQDLTPSALDALRPLALDAHEQPLSTVAQVSSSVGQVISGSARLRLDVEP